MADVPKKVTLVSYNSGGDTHINFLTADNRNIEDVSGITISAEPYFRAPTLTRSQQSSLLKTHLSRSSP